MPNRKLQTQDNGLYQSQYEHDACGVGMVVNIHAGKSHELVANALHVLENMRHRGAEVAGDGDGAGIMLQIPHEFILLQGIPVPEKGKYGTGLVFLPKNEQEQQEILSVMIEEIERRGLQLMHLRNVPTNSDCLGEAARATEPAINTLEFLGKDGRLTGVKVQEVEWAPTPGGGRPTMVPKGEPFVIKAEMALLAMGFLKPEHPQYPDNVFLCGDAANGASLVVRAMASGIDAARRVDEYLTNNARDDHNAH